MYKHFTVRDMYEYAKAHQLKLLSDFNGEYWGYDFWEAYRDNYQMADKAFMKKTASFIYYFDNENAEIEDVTLSFIEDVNMLLTLNAKKYIELSRIYRLEDEDNDFLNNYNITENVDRDISNVYGSRSDSTNETFGERNDELERKIAGLNSTNYSNDFKQTDKTGQQTNSNTFNKGQQTDLIGDDIKRDKTGRFNKSSVDLIKKQDEYWSKALSYLQIIFNDIIKELLLV